AATRPRRRSCRSGAGSTRRRCWRAWRRPDAARYLPPAVPIARRGSPATLARSIRFTTRPCAPPLSAFSPTCASLSRENAARNRFSRVASGIALPPTTTSPDSGISRTSEAFDGSISCACPEGRLILIPDFFCSCSSSFCCCSTRFSWLRSTCTASALTMKSTTITRKTSVSGVMLISAKIAPPSSSPPPSSAMSGCFPIAIAIAFRPLGLLALRARLVLLGLGLALHLARLRVARLIEQELEELVGEQLHLRGDPARALAEEVEQDDRLDGDEDAGGRDDQRVRDRAGDLAELDRLLRIEIAHRHDDADHRPEQADERRGRADGAEHPQPRSEILVDPQALAVDRRDHVLRPGPTEPLVANEEDVGDRRRGPLARRAA